MSDDPVNLVRQDAALALAGLVEALGPLRGGRLLVTGGTGFMGSWLAEAVAWLNDAHGFGLGLTLLARSVSDFAARVPHLACRSDLTLVEQDVQSVAGFAEDYQWVIHAAGNPDNRQHATDPLRTMRTIVNGTDAVLEACTRLSGLASVLVVSSGLVYGPQPLAGGLQNEVDFRGQDPARPSQCYVQAKRQAETLAAVYRSQHRLPVTIVRPFAFIGPYQRLDRPWAVNNFLRDALAQAEIRIQGDGLTVRSYMYGADMAAWLLRMLASGEQGGAYNLGSPETVSLKDLAALILRIVGGRGSIALGTGGPCAGRPSRLAPDVARAAGLGLGLGFSLEQALTRTVFWHRGRGRETGPA
jgi:dTDP-glucose 4,6-dehydratase